ncbi:MULTISPECIES: hypothetical protein [Legionella]|uniref:Uncharacterized protein n=1 Tax=Legionella septentrionalis TaxID=2498109 RepID=A0A433JJ86_9GAMM|nr:MULTISPECIES: hypothetical protein [Legionella]MCP0913199.1 hypothetical protein [Legionella sp. 27cVA30]RUQ88042.1 hypothetical protein EKM59_06225 [Legionella septentrionalis]RUR02421.1 hypothetical protein ELY11_01460 [Legionella septentrionalis]RUR10365.1 hypothetical protein ELY14_05705 [Legionella septentrionalis]RUR17079.1 hypothetical protein ELY10_01655 [Legionella septentrionalis]
MASSNHEKSVWAHRRETFFAQDKSERITQGYLHAEVEGPVQQLKNKVEQMVAYRPAAVLEAALEALNHLSIRIKEIKNAGPDMSLDSNAASKSPYGGLSKQNLSSLGKNTEPAPESSEPSPQKPGF